tara:strand:- start:1027 stop:1215 length:189 start_codon:yes stop_codon:yes gene_type:complete
MTEEIEYFDIPEYKDIEEWEIKIEKPICEYCGRALIRWREKDYKDWNKRKLHRTCWKKKNNL